MKNIKMLKLLYIASFLAVCPSMLPAQAGIKLIEENKERKYTLIKTNVSNDCATILRDTLNEFNRYPSSKAMEQYTPSLSDIQNFELAIKSSFALNGDLVIKSLGEMLFNDYGRFNRQYSGYIDKEGDKILVVCFLDFSNMKKAKKFFSNWKYQNGYLASGLFLDGKPPHISCFAYNFHFRVLTRFTV